MSHIYIYIHISQESLQAGLPVSLSTEMMRTFNSCPSCTDVLGGQQKSDKTWGNCCFPFICIIFCILIQDVSLKKLSPQLQQLGRPLGHPVSCGVGPKAEGMAQNPWNPTWILNFYVKLSYSSKHPPQCLNDVQHVLHWIWFV